MTIRERMERNEDKLYGMVSRIETLDQCWLAEQFVDRCYDEGKIDVDMWDQLRMAISWTYRELECRARLEYTAPYAV